MTNWIIGNEFLISKEQAEIKACFRVNLYCDGAYAFNGKNIFGETVLGTVISEDDDAEIIRYIHSIPNNEELRLLESELITYLDYLRAKKFVFIVDTKGHNDILQCYCVSIDTIPSDFLPMKDAVIPWVGIEKFNLPTNSL